MELVSLVFWLVKGDETEKTLFFLRGYPEKRHTHTQTHVAIQHMDVLAPAPAAPLTDIHVSNTGTQATRQTETSHWNTRTHTHMPQEDPAQFEQIKLSLAIFHKPESPELLCRSDQNDGAEVRHASNQIYIRGIQGAIGYVSKEAGQRIGGFLSASL